MLESEKPKKDVNLRTAQLVQLLYELGPDVPEISRQLGQFKESVRYRYKEKILNKGMSVQAMPNHEALGLKRVIAVVDFAEEFQANAPAILTAMSELCYLVNFAKTLPESKYVLHASVPEQFVAAFSRFLEFLKRKGMFTSVESYTFDWFRNVPMRAEHYDFETGRWDYDWSGSRSRPGGLAATVPSGLQKFDRTDLLIVKELQRDANQSLKKIAEELGINYKKLAWHFATHVVQRRLVNGYRINWLGSRYDFKLDKAMHRMHKYFFVNVYVGDLDNYSKVKLLEGLNKIPFIWAEAVGKGYFAELAIPVEQVTETFQYLEQVVQPIRRKVKVPILDATNALAFTISYKLYDEKSKSWVFNEQELSARFENLIMQITQNPGEYKERRRG